MTLRYYDYENIDINLELKKIKESKEIELYLKPTNKNCLFILGILFALGKKIKLLNESELNLTETKKSFSMMPYVWSKISDNNFPDKDFLNVITEMDKKIENIKRLGVKVEQINNNPIDNKIFLICPVRNATETQKKWIENYVEEKLKEGYIVHAPHLHTVQNDLFGGYAICRQNALAVASSNEINIYYDQTSTGSVFDLGVAYALNKKLVLLNEEEIELRENDFIDSLIKKWKESKNNKKLVLKK